MRDVRNDTNVLSETIGGLGKLGRTATFAISAPLATLGSYAVQAASDFDGAMRNINSIAMLGEGQFKDLSAAVLEFGATTRGGAVESANSLYTVFSAGITDTATAMDIMKVATQTAEAGLADMETTTESLVATVLGFGQAEMDVVRASDNLTQMVQIGVGSMQQFASATAKVVPPAKTLGIEIEELYASLAFLTQRGNNAAVASTQIRAAMTALMKPTEAMEGAFRSLGVKGAEDLIDKFGGMEGAFKALIGTTDGTSASISAMFANIRGKAFVDALIGDPDAYSKAIADFEAGVEGATGRAHREQMKSFAAQWDLMTSAIEGAGIAIGTVLLPVITPIIHGITDLFNGLATLNPQILEMGVAFAGAVTVAAPLLWLLASIVSPVGLLIGTVGGLGTVFASNFGQAESAINDFLASTPALQNIKAEIDGLFGEIEPPTVDQLLPTEPVQVNMAELVTITDASQGTLIWDSYVAQNDYTWEEFKDEWIRLNGDLILNFGEVVTIPDANLTDRVTEAMIVDAGGLEAYIAQQEKIELQSSDFFMMNDPVGKELPFQTKLMLAISRVKEDLPEALNSVITELAAWADTHIGAGLEAIASLFVGTFDTNVVSNSIATVFDFDFQQHFPVISQNLATLADAIGNWLIIVGIPTIAKGIGRFIGEIGAMIGKGFGLIGSFISGGGIEDGASTLGDSVIDPFLEGFGEAADANGIETGIDSILTGIAGALAVYAVANYGIFGAASAAIGKAISLSMSAVNFAGSMGLTLLQKLGASLAATAASSSIAGAFAGLASALKFQLWYALNTAFVAIKGTALVQGLSLWASGLVASAAGALASAWATATAAGGAIASAIGTAVAAAPILAGVAVGLVVDFFLPESFKQGIRDTIGEGLADVLGEENWDSAMRNFENSVYAALGRPDLMSDAKPVDIALNNVSFTLSQGLTDASTMASMWFEGFDEELQIQINKQANANDWTLDELVVAISAWEAELTGIPTTQLIAGLESLEWSEPLTFTGDWIADLKNAPTVQAGSEPVGAFGDDFTIPQANQGIGTDFYNTVKDEVETAATTYPTVVKIWDDTELDTYATNAGATVSASMLTAVGEGFANGDLTAESFNTDFLTPFTQNWVATFGAESPVQAATTSWVSGFTSSSTSVVAQAVTTQLGVNKAMIGMSAVIDSVSRTISENMTAAKGTIASLLLEIRKLASISTNLQIKVEVSGEINAPQADASAAGGLDRVPYDGFMVETHKDEMILPANLANNIRDMASIPSQLTGAGSTTSNNTHNNQTTIIIDGDIGVDAFLEEMDRRGIYIG